MIELPTYTPTPLHPYTLGAAADLGDGLTLMVVGMLVVFVALLVLLSIIAAMNRLMPPAPEVSPTSTPASESVKGGIPPHHLAVIVAAATVALDRPAHIRDVKPL